MVLCNHTNIGNQLEVQQIIKFTEHSGPVIDNAHRLAVLSRHKVAHDIEPKTGLKLMRRLAVYSYLPGDFWAKSQKLAKNGTDCGNFHTIGITQCSVYYIQ